MKRKLLLISSILVVMVMVFGVGVVGCEEPEPAPPEEPAPAPAPPPAPEPAPEPPPAPPPAPEPEIPPGLKPPIPTDVEEISWEEAVNNIGAAVSVCGKIFGGDVYTPPNVTLLLGGPLMQGIAIEVEAGTFDGDPIALFDGEYVCVTGTITPDFFGAPLILVYDESQIVIGEEPEVVEPEPEVVEIEWGEAVNYIGQPVTVCGPIIDSIPIGGPTLLGMGTSGMEAGGVGIELDASILAQLPEDLYVGQTICVTGSPYTNPIGGASILVTDPAQISVPGEAPAETGGTTVDWQDAINYIGQEVTVCGPIIDSIPIGGPTLLGMGTSGMEAGGVGIELDASILAQLPEDLYVGQTICVTGSPYTNPIGGASILVTDPAQISVQ